MSTKLMVCYGGCWNYTEESLQLIYQGRIMPAGYDFDLGFRVCVDKRNIYGGSWHSRKHLLVTSRNKSIPLITSDTHNILGFRVVSDI